ncbi:hypothetical protein HF577_16800 [Pseudonocardia xinjiangensis]|uniref:PDZ domain-containing protein n=1 Tax=Pseudonocardia xinjiangensis TaxID=75289 RepID=A0ABX1REA7_9PSEU|nr:hypothetical protein [Pseudonocardia xinjiangensis]NMH78735.1 hypothetical protein [Pseudonocardia xinjiangensis]
MPGGQTLRLVKAPQGGDGFPAAPSRPGTAAMARSGATTVITLPSDTGTVGLTRGGTIRLTDADGNPAELDVRDQRTVDASTAADLVAAGRRQLLLVVPRDNGEVLVVIAS